ncbi:hypothetical protein ACFL56_02720 [Candidatus Margulisiibacteriota bacterium]
MYYKKWPWWAKDIKETLLRSIAVTKQNAHIVEHLQDIDEKLDLLLHKKGE